MELRNASNPCFFNSTISTWKEQKTRNTFIHTVDFHTIHPSERKSIYLLSSVRRESFDSDCLLYKGTGGYPLRKLYSQSLSSSDQELKHLPSFLSFFFSLFFSPPLFRFTFFIFLHARARVGCSQDVVRSAPDVGRGEEKFLPGNERRIRGDFAGIKLRSEGRRSKVSLTGQAFVAGKFPCLGLNRIVVEKCLQEITATNVAP